MPNEKRETCPTCNGPVIKTLDRYKCSPCAEPGCLDCWDYRTTAGDTADVEKRIKDAEQAAAREAAKRTADYIYNMDIKGALDWEKVIPWINTQYPEGGE